MPARGRYVYGGRKKKTEKNIPRSCGDTTGGTHTIVTATKRCTQPLTAAQQNVAQQ